MAARAVLPALLASACLLSTPASADTLKEALTRAYQDNPSLEAARAQQRALDETVPIQRSFGLPSVDLSVTHVELLQQSTPAIVSPSRRLSGSANLGVPIYQGGAVRNGIRAAEERVEAGRADLRGTESALFSAVVAAYMDVILNEALVGLAANNIEVLGTNLEATSDRFQIGDLTRTDVAQSQSRLAIAEGDLFSARANLIAARENYVALVGVPPDDLQPPPPLPALPASPDEAVDVALANNPDLIAAIERAQAAGYDIEVAGAGRLPTLSVFTRSDYTNFLGTLTPENNVGTDITAGVTLSVPIFQGGRVAAQQRQAGAQARAALEQAIAVERDVIASVRAAYSSWRASRAIIESSQLAVEAAALSLEGVRAENTVGNRTVLDILDAQQELLRAQVQLVTARRNAYVAGFNLLAEMGRAEARDLGLGDDGVLYDPVANYDRVRGIIWDWQRDPLPVATSSSTVDIPAADGEIGPSDSLSEFGDD
ncbi:TolC family outer membrane protein [Aurantiacibacter gangjinensis]|uniref:Membrane protein n=1 Tax=Aurantiacibacter gangjinensis TaxID=502682 RepID=A0A0G9MLN3_9SPHN|nr:TolC family outer membrane protein [Aurantiacibacter gangjinensis]APE27496.1 Type I secretion outer membrane protein, TolC precursor [Aurantiacibacter gangjinensis]KLE31554.1 membrane protein [Aurantiacibacter gangjinensis]